MMDRPTFTPLDPDYDHRVRASFDAQAAMHTFGISISSLGPGWIDLEFDHQDQFTQQHGFIHAGVVSAALDSACGYAAFSLMTENSAVLTVEYKVNLLRPANAQRYLVSAEVVKPGRTLTVCRATARSADGGEPIAVMTGTLMALVDSGIQH